MKKFLGTIILALLFCSNSFAGEMNLWKKKFKLPTDVMQGYKNSWNFCCNYDRKTHLTPDYAFQFVNKSDGHPVRLGEQSVRFELRRGDCGVSPNGYDDCAIKDPENGMTSERHEISLNVDNGSPLKGETWNTYSIFLPKDFPRFHFEHITMGQFHGDGDLAVGFNWNISYEGGYEVQRRTSCHLKENRKLNIQTGCSTRTPGNHRQTLIPEHVLLGKWHDIVFNVKWTTKKNGYLKQWINGKLIYHYQGNTKTPGEMDQFQFGIYRGPTPETPKEKTAIAYFDEIRFAKKSCTKLKLEDLGYSCDELESQKILKIDNIIEKLEKYSNKFMAVIKSKKDEKYLFRVFAKTEKLAKKEGLKKCKEEGKKGCYVHYSGLKPEY